MAATEKAATMPMFEGHRVSEHTVDFSGNVKVEDLELVKEMSLGADVTLVLRGRVVARKHSRVTDKEGNVVGTRSASIIGVDSVVGYDE